MKIKNGLLVAGGLGISFFLGQFVAGRGANAFHAEDVGRSMVAPNSSEKAQEARLDLPARRRLRRSSGSLGSMLYSYDKASMKQKVTYGGSLQSGYWLNVTNLDKATQVSTKYEYTSALEIKDVAAHSKDVFYVLCETTGGSQVIEKWQLRPKRAQLAGGPLAYRMKRTEVYSGTGLGVIDLVASDPAGAFLLIAHVLGDFRISQLDLGGSGTVTTVVSSSTTPELSLGLLSMGRAEHEQEGLLWICYLAGENPYHAGILRDLSGDGFLDDWTVYDAPTMKAMYPVFKGGSPWANDFVSYPPE